MWQCFCLLNLYTKKLLYQKPLCMFFSFNLIYGHTVNAMLITVSDKVNFVDFVTSEWPLHRQNYFTWFSHEFHMIFTWTEQIKFCDRVHVKFGWMECWVSHEIHMSCSYKIRVKWISREIHVNFLWSLIIMKFTCSVYTNFEHILVYELLHYVKNIFVLALIIIQKRVFVFMTMNKHRHSNHSANNNSWANTCVTWTQADLDIFKRGGGFQGIICSFLYQL